MVIAAKEGSVGCLLHGKIFNAVLVAKDVDMPSHLADAVFKPVVATGLPGALVDADNRHHTMMPRTYVLSIISEQRRNGRLINSQAELVEVHVTVVDQLIDRVEVVPVPHAADEDERCVCTKHARWERRCVRRMHDHGRASVHARLLMRDDFGAGGDRRHVHDFGFGFGGWLSLIHI